MKIRGQTYFLLILLAAILFMFALTPPLSFGSKLLPMILGGIALVLILIQLVTELTGQKKVSETKDAKKETVEAIMRPNYRAYMIAGMWVGGFALGVYLLGFVIAIALFVSGYLRAHHTGWLPSIIFAVVMAGGSYGLFQFLMAVQLWPGIIPPLILPQV